ncbi:unnamed protein product [Boreogadus saida]
MEVIPEKAEGTLSVVGLVDDVTRLEPTLNDLLTRIEKRVLRENSSITQEFEISKDNILKHAEDQLKQVLISNPCLDKQGKAVKIIGGIVEDCLNRAEDQDQETIQVFTDALNKQLPKTTKVPALTQSKSSLFSKVTSASGLHEITIGHVRVQVVLGDITKETTDVIVNSSNESFSLKSGVSSQFCTQLVQL